MATDTQPLETLYKAPGGGFNEFMPISSSTVESYCALLPLDEADAPAGPGQHKGARQEAAKPKRRRSRNAHQLHLNKLAQVRYRERKRAKQASLESEVKELNDKAAELRQLEQQSDALEAQNAALQQQLAQREAELQAARQSAAVAAQPTSSASDSPGSSKPQRSPAERKAELNRLVQKWLDTVEEIRQLYGLLLMDGGGCNAGAVLKRAADLSWLPAGQQRLLLNVSERVDLLVETVVSLCVRVLRLDGHSVESLMSANFDRCKSLAGWKDGLKWVRAAQELNLSREQAAAMLQARTAMLGKLQSIYAERQQLNAEAARALAGSGAELAPGEQQRLFEVLSRLEDNLRAEQRAMAEQEYVTFKHLLTPIQSGLFILKAFPDHCDCLALLNAVHQLESVTQ